MNASIYQSRTLRHVSLALRRDCHNGCSRFVLATRAIRVSTRSICKFTGIAANRGRGSIVTSDPCSFVRTSAQFIISQAKHVTVDSKDAITAAAKKLQADHIHTVSWDDAGWHYADDASSGGPMTAQYVLVLDALNWCFWPSSTSMEYEQLAVGITNALRKDVHSLDADRLTAITGSELATWFAPHDFPDAEQRAGKLREVGAVLCRDFQGQAVHLVAAAKHSAVQLVALLVRHFPGFRDETTYAGVQVAFYKRAQIATADMWAAYGQLKCSKEAAGSTSAAPFSFYDMDALTMFADYRVPQILRAMGVLTYSAALAAKVDSKAELPAGGEEEVEIRAATVEAVERLREALQGSSPPVQLSSVEIDWWLWQRGEEQKDKLAPHHKVLTSFY